MRTCLVLADVTVFDVREVRKFLSAADFDLRLVSDVTGSGPISDQLQEALAGASVVMACLSDLPSDVDVYFQMGAATALEIPVVVFARQDANLARWVHLLPLIRQAPDAAISLGVALNHAASQHEKERPERKDIERNHPSPERVEETLIDWLSSLLRAEGGTTLVEQPGPSSTSQFDLLLWLPWLATTVGTPLPIEVRRGYLSQSQLEKAVEQADEALGPTTGNFALLLYEEGPGELRKELANRWPKVLTLRIDELQERLRYENFPRLIASLRNERAHRIR